MRFTEEKKNEIKAYILEKIDQGSENIISQTMDTWNINQSTVHTYLNRLEKEGEIQRIKRGTYRLSAETHTYHLTKTNGDIVNEDAAYSKYIRGNIEGLPLNVRTIWNYAFTEMMNNVIDHSDAQNVDITVEKNILNTSIIIQDDGVGIFEKIKTYFNYDTVDDAIIELFKGKLTTDSSRHSGEGIFFTSKMVDMFYIVSSGRVFTNNRFDESNLSMIDNINSSGTRVVMTLSNTSLKRTDEIFNEYSTIDEGFRKTRIPLKNAFDSSPVSRSQAKRLYNNLDKFTDVELDFEGIDWIGQGFAHQLFVLFAGEHPEIKITPVNMSEKVQYMYSHVINSIDK